MVRRHPAAGAARSGTRAYCAARSYERLLLVLAWRGALARADDASSQVALDVEVERVLEQLQILAQQLDRAVLGMHLHFDAVLGLLHAGEQRTRGGRQVARVLHEHNRIALAEALRAFLVGRLTRVVAHATLLVERRELVNQVHAG